MERKRVPLLSCTVTKNPVAICCYFGDRKNMVMIIRRGAELSSRDVREKQFGEIIRARASKQIKTQHGQFVLDARTDGKPN